MCLVGGLHSEGERVVCAECWRCGDNGGPRSRVPAPPGADATAAGAGSDARAPGSRRGASLPAWWVGARLGHHAACAALDESENGKYR